MIAQLLLTTSCLAFLFYGLGHFQHSRVAGYLMTASGFLAIWFIWRPDYSTHVANLLGIGRGTDLLLYIWVVVGASELLVLHVKLRSQAKMITELARYIALSEANASLCRCAGDRL